jgi:glycine cleavage system aminomethyltransferase T
MPAPSLQEGIDRAGSALNLLWKPDAPPWKPPVVPAEFVGWRVEQTAAFETVALSNLSHHMRDLFISGPDATRLLSDYSANNYENFAVGQAKQFVPVTSQGHIVQDGILMRDAEDRYTLTGPPASQSWILFHGQQGAYDVRDVLGDDLDYLLTYGRYRIEAGGALVGITFYTAHIDRLRSVLALSLIANQHAVPGTQVELAWGEHPGGDVDRDCDLGFKQIRATVQPSPYNEYARTKYRADAATT